MLLFHWNLCTHGTVQGMDDGGLGTAEIRERWSSVFWGLSILPPRAAVRLGMKKLEEACIRWRKSALTQLCLFALGIQKNAQALQYMLKHPLLCRSSKPRLDTLQKHYVPKEKRVNV